MVSSPVPTSLGALLVVPPTIYAGNRGVLHLWEAPRVVVTRISGVLTVEIAQAIETATRRAVAKHSSHRVFHDVEEMANYDSEARSKLTNLYVEVTKHVDSIDILARALTVRMAVKAVSLVLRSIRMHDDRPSFEGALRRELDARRP